MTSLVTIRSFVGETFSKQFYTIFICSITWASLLRRLCRASGVMCNSFFACVNVSTMHDIKVLPLASRKLLICHPCLCGETHLVISCFTCRVSDLLWNKLWVFFSKQWSTLSINCFPAVFKGCWIIFTWVWLAFLGYILMPGRNIPLLLIYRATSFRVPISFTHRHPTLSLVKCHDLTSMCFAWCRN